ncbi:MAG: hypothetical protein DMG13_14825 [Acidobacteria bacterium]|nr:MAG: hypothetical protein DMG13_14825 [Acidobacteriota bacterium]
MIISPERFWQGYSWEQYLGRIRRNRELFEKSYDAVELTGEEVDWIHRFEHTTYVLGIGEDWCPDVHGNLPVMARIASCNPDKIMLRIFPRDEQENGESAPYAEVPRSPDPVKFKNHDLMSHYLYGSGRSMSIPAFAFFDEHWSEFGKFLGGRPKLYWYWIDKMGKQEAIQTRMGEFARHNYGREMFWEIRRLLESHPALKNRT